MSRKWGADGRFLQFSCSAFPLRLLREGVGGEGVPEAGHGKPGECHRKGLPARGPCAASRWGEPSGAEAATQERACVARRGATVVGSAVSGRVVLRMHESGE